MTKNHNLSQHIFKSGFDLALGLRRRLPGLTQKGFDCIASNVAHYNADSHCLLWGHFDEEEFARPLLIDPLKHHKLYPPAIQSVAAARFVWQVMNRCFACEGLVVRHLCANARCLQPMHLALGTTFENNRDRFLTNRGFVLTPRPHT